MLRHRRLVREGATMFAFSEATSVLRQSLPFQESVRFGANKVVPQPQVLPLGCDGRVLQVAFAANGRTLAAGGDEGKGEDMGLL